jgi:signal transduction histidine kinase
VTAWARKLAQVEPTGKSLDTAPGIWGEMFDIRGFHIPASEWASARALRGEATNAKECCLVRWDHSSFYVLVSASAIRDSDSRIVGAVTTLTEISEHRKIELAVREEAIWAERARMAAEIHDNLSPGLNAIVLQLDAAEHDFAGDVSRAQKRVSLALALARQNLTGARRSMWILSHPDFDSEDPASALSFLAKQLFQGSSTKLQLSLQSEVRPLVPSVRREVVQIAKEAMVNALKHADAKTVQVELQYGPQTVRLSVNDDGRGFVRMPIPNGRRGYGLFGMRTRAENLGGKLVVDSHLHKGTRITLTLPFSRLAKQPVSLTARG